jgi:signal transduction histidine kinase
MFFLFSEAKDKITDQVKNLDLRRRFLSKILAGILLSSVIFLVSMSFILSKFYSDYTLTQWQAHANKFAEDASYKIIMSSKEGVNEIANSYVQEGHIVGAFVYSQNNALFGSSGLSYHCPSSRLALLNPGLKYWCISAPIYQLTYVVGGTANKDYPSIGSVKLIYSTVDFKNFFIQILIAFNFVVLLFCMAVFFLIRRHADIFTSIIDELVRVFDAVKENRRGVKLAFSGSPEQELIRETLNSMLDALENNEILLENRVAQRTGELRIALDSAKSMNVHKSRIITTTTHEMKTPLNAIMWSLETLYDVSENEMNRDLIAKALDRSNQLNTNINNFLTLFKLESNTYRMELASLSIRDLIQECVDKSIMFIEKNHNRVVLEGDNVFFQSDKAVMENIINNLLGNAFKFTQNGTITISWMIQESHFHLDVIDTGCGMSDEGKTHAFDEFWQEDMSLTRKYGGHGLGLAIVYNSVVTLLKGHITIKDNPSGKGTVFSLSIPFFQKQGDVLCLSD